MSSEFEKATAIEQTAPNTFLGRIPDEWQQGRGAFGGVAIGVLARALLASEADPARTLRSLTADLCAPLLPGSIELRVSTLRRGANVSFLDAQLHQAGALVAHANAVLATTRAVAPVAMAPTPPQPTPWREVATIPIEAPSGPVFASKYEYRPTGPLPFSGGKDPVAEGWLREKSAPAYLDAAALIGLLDAWWPTCFAIEPGPRAVATVGYTMQLLADPSSLSATEPLFYRARGVASSGSYFVEFRELWSDDRLVAMNQQTFAVLT